MRHRGVFVVVLVLGAAVWAAPARATAPFDLTLSGPADFVPGDSLAPFAGALTVAGAGVPSQTIALYVDGVLSGTAATTIDGAYAFSLPPFTGTATRHLRAVAFGGLPLETVATLDVMVRRYPVTVAITGDTLGSVSSSPAGIGCPGDCTDTFPATSTVTLTATDGAGVFGGWTGDCAGSNPICSLTIGGPRSVGAVFLQPAHLVLSPSFFDFGTVLLGGPPVVRTFTVTNDGEATSGNVNAVVSGPDGNQFSISHNNCIGFLAGGGSCTFDLHFQPVSTGTKVASVSADATPGGVASSSVMGRAVTQAQLQILPTSYNFGSQPPGGQSFGTFTVRNVGGSNTGPVSISLSGASEFVKTGDGCTGFLLAPSQQCLVTVRYMQSFVGTHTATLSAMASPGGFVSSSLVGS